MKRLIDKKVIILSVLGLLSVIISFVFFSKIHSYFGQNVKVAIFSFLVAVSIFTVLIIYLKYNTLRSKYKVISKVFLLLLSVPIIYASISPIKKNFTNPNEWDFLCWYMNGSVADKGLNFYDPQNYAEVYKQIDIPFKPKSTFFEEIIKVGFLYYPPTIFLFSPLGLFNYTTAQIIWDILLLIFLILDFLILWKFILKDKTLVGFSILLVMVLLNQSTKTTFTFEHYTFIFLLPVLLFWKDRDLPISGLWLALAIFLKPIFLILILFPILRKNWRVIGITVSVSIIICFFTIGIFGTQIFFSYFTNNVVSNVPHYQYIDIINQSLLSTILRFTNYNISVHSPLSNPFFLISGFISTIITSYLIYKIPEDKKVWGLALLFPYMLFIYPGNQVMYSAILFPVFILLIQSNGLVSKGKVTIPAIIAIIYAVGYHIEFLSLLILWCILLAICLYQVNLLPLKIFNRNYYANV